MEINEINKILKGKPINKFFDHTLLKPEATLEDVNILCEEAMSKEFYSVCVNSCYVVMAKEKLKNSDVKVATVVGFPLGANSTAVKAFEAMNVSAQGADEVDMVMNIGAFKSGNYKYVAGDINAVAKNSPLTKVIIETALLTEAEIIKATELAMEAGADFVKTSTGFASRGAALEDIKIIKDNIKGGMKIKASGGIKTLEQTIEMIKCGADRIGSSASMKIIKEYEEMLKGGNGIG